VRQSQPRQGIHASRLTHPLMAAAHISIAKHPCLSLPPLLLPPLSPSLHAPPARYKSPLGESRDYPPAGHPHKSRPPKQTPRCCENAHQTLCSTSPYTTAHAARYGKSGGRKGARVNKGTICVISFAAHKSFPYTRHSPPLPPSLPPSLPAILLQGLVVHKKVQRAKRTDA